MIYLLLGFVFFTFSFFEILNYKRQQSEYWLVLFCMVLILFAGLRDGRTVGTDSPAYFAHYIDCDYEVEYGYRYLNVFFSRYLEANYNVFLIFLNSISIYCMYKYLKKNILFYVLPLMVFFSDLYVYFNLSGIRQAIAISFTSYAVYFALTKKRKPFIILIILASLFHYSSLVFIFAYFIPSKLFKIKHYFFITLLMFIIFYFAKDLIVNIEYLSAKMDFYTMYQEKSDNLLSLYIISLIKRTFILIAVWFFRDKILKLPNLIFYLNAYIFGMIIFLSTYLISPDFGVRFSSYYIILDVIILGNLLAISGQMKQRVLLTLFFGLVSFYKLYGYLDMESYVYSFLEI